MAEFTGRATRLISKNNSSVAALTAAAVFTGLADDISTYATITVSMDSDVDGTCSMQFSPDGTNWDRAKVVSLKTEISSGSPHTLEVISQYFRVVFTNGSSNQAHFRLQTIYHKYRSGFLTSSPDEVISKINDAQIVRVANDPFLDISRALYADKYSVHKFGYNGTVPNGSFADVWSYGPTDPTYNWPIASEKFRVKSGGSADDTAAGDGARTVQILFLDSVGNQQQEQLTLAGASASAATVLTGRRVLRAWVDTVGTILENNASNIIIENESTNQIVAVITAGVGQTEMSQYTIPLGYTGYLSRIEVSVSVGTNKDADVKMWQRLDAFLTSAPFGAKRLVRQWVAIQGADNIIEYKSLPSFPPLTDLWFEAKGNGATTEADVDYDLILVKDEAPTIPQ